MRSATFPLDLSPPSSLAHPPLHTPHILSLGHQLIPRLSSSTTTPPSSYLHLSAHHHHIHSGPRTHISSSYPPLSVPTIPPCLIIIMVITSEPKSLLHRTQSVGFHLKSTGAKPTRARPSPACQQLLLLKLTPLTSSFHSQTIILLFHDFLSISVASVIRSTSPSRRASVVDRGLCIQLRSKRQANRRRRSHVHSARPGTFRCVRVGRSGVHKEKSHHLLSSGGCPHRICSAHPISPDHSHHPHHQATDQHLSIQCS